MLKTGPKGWIHALRENGIQQPGMKNLYTSSLYFIITSFTSVGYGDIKGNTELEYWYQLLIELVGLGFFGYLTGVFR